MGVFDNVVLVPPPSPPPIAANGIGIMNDNDMAINAANDGNGIIVHFDFAGVGHNFVPSNDGNVFPVNVTHDTVDPSLKRIRAGKFSCNSRLTTVDLPEGLESIGGSAFSKCVSLKSVELPDSLEEIGYKAFRLCTSLQSIRIPPRVKSISKMAFKDCDALRYVYLSEGLKYIREEAFADCPLLRHITIPSSVKRIHPDAFKCNIIWMNPLLEKVQFCDEIEELVSGASLDWWGNGASERALRTFNFLVRCNIPARLVQPLIARQWQANIHDMLRGIPSVNFVALKDYFNTIESKLTGYESLHNATTVLELAIWKSKISEQYGQGMDNVSATAKLQCRVECGACVIIPNVLSFL